MSNPLTNSLSGDASALQTADLFALGSPTTTTLGDESAPCSAPFADVLVANENSSALAVGISPPVAETESLPAASAPALQTPTETSNPPPLLTLTFHPRLIGQLNAALHRAHKFDQAAAQLTLCPPPRGALPPGLANGASAPEKCLCVAAVGESDSAEKNPALPAESAEKIAELLRQGVAIIEYIFHVMPSAPVAAPTPAPVPALAANADATTGEENSGQEQPLLFATKQNVHVGPDLGQAGATSNSISTSHSLKTPGRPDPVRAVSPSVPSEKNFSPNTASASVEPTVISEQNAATPAPRATSESASPAAPAKISPAASSLSYAAAQPKTSADNAAPVRPAVSAETTPAEKAASPNSFSATHAAVAQATRLTPEPAPQPSSQPTLLTGTPVAAVATSHFFAQAKVAAQRPQGISLEPAGELSSVVRFGKKSLSADRKGVAEARSVVGMSTANSGAAMSIFTTEAPTTNPFAAVSTLSATLERAWRHEDFAPEAATPSLASQAVHVVREISDIADGLWATERNSVELRFHFEGHDQLSVRVEYRDGDVRATFRTNSGELREVLSGEWQQQQAKQGPVPYTMLPPVFENAPAPAGRSGFSFNENSARDQNAQQFSQHARDDAHSRGQSSRSFFSGEAETPTRVTPSAASSPARHPSARLLHAQA